MQLKTKSNKTTFKTKKDTTKKVVVGIADPDFLTAGKIEASNDSVNSSQGQNYSKSDDEDSE